VFDLTFIQNHEDATIMWESGLTEIISNYYQNTVIKFKIKKNYPHSFPSVYVGIVDRNVKQDGQICLPSDLSQPKQWDKEPKGLTKLKYCAFRLAQLFPLEVSRSKWPMQDYKDREALVCMYDDRDTPLDNDGFDNEGFPIFRRDCEETVAILNTATPVSSLLHTSLSHSDEFKLQYNRDSKLLTFSNNRGFSYSRKHCAEGCRFFFKVAGLGISILQNTGQLSTDGEAKSVGVTG